jgi:hypothetical protein
MARRPRSGHATLVSHMSYARSRGAIPRTGGKGKPGSSNQPRTQKRGSPQPATGPNAWDQGSYVGGYN